jgi:nitrogen-specific signal transduction histidine kinase
MIGALVVFEDVTQPTATSKNNCSSAREAFVDWLAAAGVAHEVNTPLTGVSSYTQMLLGMLPETIPSTRCWEKVRAPGGSRY